MATVMKNKNWGRKLMDRLQILRYFEQVLFWRFYSCSICVVSFSSSWSCPVSQIFCHFRMCTYIWELPNRRWSCVPCKSILSSTNSPLLARGLGWVHPEKLNQRICTDYAHNLFAFLCSKLIYSRKAKL